MSNVVHRFTLGGLTDVQLGVQLVPGSKEPIMPRTQDRTLAIAGRDGAWDFGADLRPRTIVLPCEFVDTLTQEELQAAIRVLAAHLVDVHGKPRELDYTSVKEPGLTYRVRYLGKLDIKRLLSWGSFSLPLTAFDPYAYEEAELDEEAITGSPQTMVVVSSGTVSTPGKIRVKNDGVAAIDGFTLTRVVED